MKKILLFLAAIGTLAFVQTSCESNSRGYGAHTSATGTYQSPHRSHAQKKYMRPR